MTPGQVGDSFTDAAADFDKMAAAAFDYQRLASPIYRRFTEGVVWSDWTSAPFLPVEAFKWSGIVDSRGASPDLTFASSGTGGARSRHPVLDVSLYRKSVTAHFESVFGNGPFHIVAHLPTYGSSSEPSSLLCMVEMLISQFGTERSGFVDEALSFDNALTQCDPDVPQIVFGTAFGLLDLVEDHPRVLRPGSKVIETGGMKTYRREITRRELHDRLAAGFEIDRTAVWSEYGMCELLSQCYTRGGEIFYPPSWLRFKVVDVENPERRSDDGYPGLLAVFDLANVLSVSAILTSDMAIERSGGFELLGRADSAEMRGCNFLMHSSP